MAKSFEDFEKRKKEIFEERKKLLSEYRPWLNPPKYTDDMPVTLALMMFDGADVTEVCRDLGIGRTSFYKYLKENSEFAAAYEVAQTWAEAYHHKIARDNLDNDDFNAILWQMIGRNRFKMAEHRTVDLPGFDAAESYTDKMQILNKALADGQLTPVEFNQLSNGIGVQARIEEITELKRVVEELQTKLNKGK